MIELSDRPSARDRETGAIRAMAWGLGMFSAGLLSFAAVLLLQAADLTNGNWLESQVNSITAIGAPVVGLIILNRQPHHRIGWIWILYGLAAGFRSIGHAIYYSSGAIPTGYSSLEYFLMWSTEAANLFGFYCLILLLLWFPDGKLISRRWRYLYVWIVLAFAGFVPFLFSKGTNWNGGAEAGGIVIENPFGWFPEDTLLATVVLGFLSIVLILVLAAISQVTRYRSAGESVRLQLRWFVVGGIFLILLDFSALFFLDEGKIEGPFALLVNLVSFLAIVPLYVSVGLAILRYRLYDIDLIIRRTLQYTVLTSVLALVYFSAVVLLQALFGRLTGERNSPLVTVVTTLGIAALFNPLRNRVQAFIDRRFFRNRYTMDQILARFAAAARDEVDIDQLSAALIGVVDETMRPEKVGLWLRDRGERAHRYG